jgi:cytochrome c peroxidase
MLELRGFVVRCGLGVVLALVACDDGPSEGEEHTHADAHDDVDAALDESGHEHSSAPAAITQDAAVIRETTGYEWDLPTGFPLPVVPVDNPMTTEKVELGRHLFYDKRLSDNETFACANCHEQRLAFADARAVGLGSTGEQHTRGAMSLANAAYALTLTWSNPTMTELEAQSAVPIFGTSPIELGMKSADEVETRVRDVPRYLELFGAAFPEESQPVTMLNVQRALASFERTLLSGRSPFDRYFYFGEEDALSESAKRGMTFVTTNEDPGHRFECNHCHGDFDFSDHVTWQGQDRGGAAAPFHQTGLYDIDGRGNYPEPNTGIFSSTQRPEDMGKFKAPTLRNIALTAPYMHDGSIMTLSEVLDHYAGGGRHRVNGKTDPLLKPFKITPQEKADIIAFLTSLTDTEFTTDPRFSDPWPPETGPTDTR